MNELNTLGLKDSELWTDSEYGMYYRYLNIIHDLIMFEAKESEKIKNRLMEKLKK